MRIPARLSSATVRRQTMVSRKSSRNNTYPFYFALGALILYLGTAPENATRAEEALRREIERIRTEAVGDEELRRAKGYLLGRYTMDRRTNERLAWYDAFYENEGVGQDYPDRYRKAVEAVTAADVLRVAKQYLEKVTTVVLRPR